MQIYYFHRFFTLHNRFSLPVDLIRFLARVAGDTLPEETLKFKLQDYKLVRRFLASFSQSRSSMADPFNFNLSSFPPGANPYHEVQAELRASVSRPSSESRFGC